MNGHNPPTVATPNFKDMIMTVHSIYPEDIPTMRDNLKESEYSLVDVRQPGEYREGHIPGARLLPLPDIEQRVDELRSTPNLVFYCRSGARSQAAASLVQEALPEQTRILNMVGGFLAWEGHAVTDMPRLEIFAQEQSQSHQSGQTLSQALLRAMDLEKAAQRFYQAAADRAGATELAKTLGTLIKVEQAHAHVIFHRLQQVDLAYASRNFADCYAEMQGDILEGGLSLEEAVAGLDQASGRQYNAPSGQNQGADRFCLGVTELALQIELMAYDLYRNLASDHAGSDLEPVFLKLAEDERNHQRLLTRTLPECMA